MARWPKAGPGCGEAVPAPSLFMRDSMRQEVPSNLPRGTALGARRNAGEATGRSGGFDSARDNSAPRCQPDRTSGVAQKEARRAH
jgi:hypothetical protein